MVSQPKLRVLYSREKIAATVRRLASEISRDYREKHPLLIAILKGSFMFLADLVRQLDFPLEIDFVTACSYGPGTETSGKVKVMQKPRSPIKDRNVLLIEDIVDTGLTTACVLDYLKRKKPASLKFCVLMDKPARRQVPIKIDYLGLSVPNKFLVGYGLDCGESYRNLPDVCVLEEEK